MDDYRVLADELAADIAAGRLRPGDRLPTQRRFARQRRIATSTAARVYRELARRGLVVGEVGRGTFVRAGQPSADPALAEPLSAPVDLDLNFPVVAQQPALLAARLGRLLRPDMFAGTLRPVGPHGTPDARRAAATLLSRAGWAPDPDHVRFAGNGRQAIAAAIAALVPVGQRLAVESHTYPVVKAIANRLGVQLVPIPMDDDGLRPDALVEAHQAAPLRAVYLQPALHNPLGTTMPDRRRAELAETLRRLDLYAIEDTVYAFLCDDLPPLAALAPDRVVLVDSLSKRVAPGLTLGLAAVPPRLADRVSSALKAGGWAATGFALAAAQQWMADGTLAAIQEAKRKDAAARQAMVRERLAGFAVRADPRAYHCWWELPEPWRAETFVAAAARRGIAVTPAAAFAVVPGHAPNAVRLALSAPSTDTLSSALTVLATLARGTPEDAGSE